MFKRKKKDELQAIRSDLESNVITPGEARERFQKISLSIPFGERKAFHEYLREADGVLGKMIADGIESEKAGKIDEAISAYEESIENKCDGSHPYNRLAIIYRKRKQYDEEIRVLEKAILVFDNIVSKKRADRHPKLEKFRIRLEKAKELKAKEES